MRAGGRVGVHASNAPGLMLEHASTQRCADTRRRYRQVCQVLGTPDKQVWPDGYKLAQTRRVKFPEYPRTALEKIMPHASGEAIEVMDGLMMWNPDHRLTAHQCLAHKYFVHGMTCPPCCE